LLRDESQPFAFPEELEWRKRASRDPRQQDRTIEVVAAVINQRCVMRGPSPCTSDNQSAFPISLRIARAVREPLYVNVAHQAELLSSFEEVFKKIAANLSIGFAFQSAIS
jgi:hypothetical protein